MRTLKFIVDKQTIRQDPTCDFTGLFPGTENYLRVEFSFSQDWNDMVKVAAFWSTLGMEYEPKVLKDGKSCIIPTEALTKASFKIQVLGKKGNNRLTTNKLTINQTGGRR